MGLRIYNKPSHTNAALFLEYKPIFGQALILQAT